MTILGVHHVQIAIPPGAEDAARRFYSGVLGLKELEKPEILKAKGGFWLEAGATQIHFGIETLPPSLKPHVAYQVTDLASWKRKLDAAGTPCRDGEPIPGYIRMEFRDPFGNRVEMLQEN